MPAVRDTDGERLLSEDEAAAHVHGICFKTGPPRRIGVELEWLVHDLTAPPLHHPAAHPPLATARLETALAALRDLPLHSALTLEPGGQVELSSQPAGSLTDCVRSVTADLVAVRARRAEHGLGLAGYGLDPARPPRRLLRLPRYRAMEAYFDRIGPAGRAMMCTSASVQVCVDAGTEEPGLFGHARRWTLAHRLGAVLVAAFAASPLLAGFPTGWRSTRQCVWAALDGGRILAPPAGRPPRDAWTDHALDAPVLCVRTDAGPWALPRNPLTFRQWIRRRRPRPPTVADLDFHLSTLFPPVRPQGHLELRMIDAQPGPDGWLVPLAVTAALFDDPAATETAYRAVKPLADLTGGLPPPRNPLWRRAARHGLADPELHAAALACFTAATEALDRLGAGPRVQAAVADFTDRYVARGRCPADDLLAARTGGLARTDAGKDPTS
jgi:glutamate--cysteine ligase